MGITGSDVLDPEQRRTRGRGGAGVQRNQVLVRSTTVRRGWKSAARGRVGGWSSRGFTDRSRHAAYVLNTETGRLAENGCCWRGYQGTCRRDHGRIPDVTSSNRRRRAPSGAGSARTRITQCSGSSDYTTRGVPSRSTELSSKRRVQVQDRAARRRHPGVAAVAGWLSTAASRATPTGSQHHRLLSDQANSGCPAWKRCRLRRTSDRRGGHDEMPR